LAFELASLLGPSKKRFACSGRGFCEQLAWEERRERERERENEKVKTTKEGKDKRGRRKKEKGKYGKKRSFFLLAVRRERDPDRSGRTQIGPAPGVSLLLLLLLLFKKNQIKKK